MVANLTLHGKTLVVTWKKYLGGRKSTKIEFAWSRTEQIANSDC